MPEREAMDFDVVIVGAGPCGLAAACRLAQLAREAGAEISTAVVEKGSEIGAHVISGAVLEPTALNELFPDWQARGAPAASPVTADEFYYLTSESAGGGCRMRSCRVPCATRAISSSASEMSAAGSESRRKNWA